MMIFDENVFFPFKSNLPIQNPSITSFNPVEGPADGGTEVTISGMYLDAAYQITAMIGSACMVER